MVPSQRGLRSPTLNGPYQRIGSVTPTSTGPFSFNVSAASNGFYRVQLPF